MTAVLNTTSPTRPDPRPACNAWTAPGFCILDEGHAAAHLPLPEAYPPVATSAGVRS